MHEKWIQQFACMKVNICAILCLLMMTVSCYVYDWSDDASPALSGDNDGDDDDDTMDDDDDMADDDDTTECTPEDLCAAAVACGYYADVSECTPWYENESNCAGMDAYIACNCGCLEADPECETWVDCGYDCYNTFCF